jgi:hypothetical protein
VSGESQRPPDDVAAWVRLVQGDLVALARMEYRAHGRGVLIVERTADGVEEWSGIQYAYRPSAKVLMGEELNALPHRLCGPLLRTYDPQTEAVVLIMYTNGSRDDPQHGVIENVETVLGLLTPDGVVRH